MTTRLPPPGRTSSSACGVVQGSGANHCLSSSGSVQARVEGRGRRVDQAGGGRGRARPVRQNRGRSCGVSLDRRWPKDARLVGDPTWPSEKFCVPADRARPARVPCYCMIRSRRGPMPDDQRLPRLAILIDADNTSPRIAAGLFEEIATFGEASVRRIYGDFSSPRLKSWADILQRHAIDPYQQFAYTSGKNASDIALVIERHGPAAQRPLRRLLPRLLGQRLHPASPPACASRAPTSTASANRRRPKAFGRPAEGSSIRRTCCRRRRPRHPNRLPGPNRSSRPRRRSRCWARPSRRSRPRMAGCLSGSWVGASPTSPPTSTHAPSATASSAISSAARAPFDTDPDGRDARCGSGRSRVDVPPPAAAKRRRRARPARGLRAPPSGRRWRMQPRIEREGLLRSENGAGRRRARVEDQVPAMGRDHARHQHDAVPRQQGIAEGLLAGTGDAGPQPVRDWGRRPARRHGPSPARRWSMP